MTTGIIWFRQDLRLADNPALVAACTACDELLAVFIDDPGDRTVSQLGSASRVWLHHSLDSLQQALQDKGTELLFAQGESLVVLTQLIKQSGATRVFWNRCYDPDTIARDTVIKKELAQYRPQTFNGLLLHEPWENLKGDGTPYRVYTPYWRAAAKALDEEQSLLTALRVPRVIPALSGNTRKRLKGCVSLDAIALLPPQDWDKALIAHWKVGEKHAKRRLAGFLNSAVHNYDDGRNLPAKPGTSRLSPHLHFGEISPRTVLNTLLAERSLASLKGGEETFAKEIVWREFAYCLIYHFPQTVDQPLDKRFRTFRWATATTAHLQAWQRGRTGVPIVDAGMRELYATGWMHNRVRMIVASYLIKNLLVPWQRGERWFRDTLVDADIASNVMGWQWTAGCGADAAPFFRIFNPVLQGEKFDKQGHYVRYWVPELESVSDKFIHKPWELDASERESIDYPEPLVDLKQTRLRALERFSEIKGTK